MRDDVRSTSLSLSLWDVGMRGMGRRQRLIMENGEETEREKGGEIQLAKPISGAQVDRVRSSKCSLIRKIITLSI